MSEKSEALKKERAELNLQLRESKARSEMAKVYLGAAKTLHGLYVPKFLEDGVTLNPEWNPDAEKMWNDSSMKTRAALVLAKEQAAHPEADIPGVFGIIIMRARARDPQAWEAQAKEVDEKQKKLAVQKVIDVVPDEIKAATG